ncbi:hypothetical protein [Alkalicoccus urumqiensis]|uniref:Uncharacterized protein n=1 Tax=Alkalicoccus urumqiensis TaxID=1548213 RepID=A0A2P6MLQ9_ALKUR|nr:hypothetical protein [Alkalicoccus urumqiensis]PRO67224.1 hypothetical protein C6I21_01290 [Alkalicoccus urumqiensis]
MPRFFHRRGTIGFQAGRSRAMGSSKSWITVMLAILLLAASMGTAAAGSFGSDVNKMLAETKAATAKYHQIERALDDGYELGSPCVENMGYHYINMEYAMTPGHDHTKPEVLFYEEMKNGKLNLVAVEFVAFGGDRPDQQLAIQKNRN